MTRPIRTFGTTAGVVLDIEGTTTPTSFVYDALFPYARAHLRRYLREHAGSAEVKEATRLLRDEHAEDAARGDVAPEWEDETANAFADSLAVYLEWLMDRDRKSPGLKLLQGHVWKRGYADGTLKGVVYPDVRPAFERWKAAGLTIAIYSSGSVLGQRLLFSNSNSGDLTGFINYYFDTGVGSKRSRDSYHNISHAIGVLENNLLFVSDIEAETEAARAAGFQTRLCVRGPNAPPVPPDVSVIHSLEEVLP
ncbi:MAG TPA: acireductone synthase [Gemmatimonadaceae bacterium]